MYKLKISRLLALSVTTAISLTTNTAIAQTEVRTGFSSAIIDAAEIGDLSKVQNLLTSGASPNERGEFGTTPLMRAVHNNNLQLVNLLLSSGANANISDVGGATAVSIAVREGHNDILDSLIKQGANLNTADNEGFTPLMRAAIASNTPAVKALLDGGAKINASNNFGETALSQAIAQNNNEIAELLKTGGADDAQKSNPPQVATSLHSPGSASQTVDDNEEDHADIIIDFSNGKLSNSKLGENYKPLVKQVASLNQKDYFAGSYYVPEKNKDASLEPADTASDSIQIPRKPQSTVAPQMRPSELEQAKADWVSNLRQVARVAASPYQISSDEMVAVTQLAVLELGTFKTEEFANKKIARLKKSFPSIFNELPLKTIAKNTPAGMTYQLNAGLLNGVEAENTCKKLVAAGINCHAQPSKLASQQEFNNFAGDAVPAAAKADSTAAAPSPEVETKQLSAPAQDSGNAASYNPDTKYDAYSAEISRRYNSLPTAAGPTDGENKNGSSGPTKTLTPDAAVTPPTSSATTPPSLLKIITPMTPAASSTQTSAPAVATTTTTTITTAPAPTTPAAEPAKPTPAATTTTVTTTVAPADEAKAAETAKEDVKTEAEAETVATPVKKKRIHHLRRLPAPGQGTPPRDLSSGQPLTAGDDGQFEVARPVRSADISNAAPIPYSQQVWVKVGNFANADAAHDFWNNLHAQNSNFADARMRTNTAVTRPDLTSLEIGPFAGEDAGKSACATIEQSDVTCAISDTLQPRTLNALPVVNSYIDDHNMPLVENYELGGGNWNIQLGTYGSVEEAQEAWQIVSKQSKHLKKISNDIVPAGDKFRLRAGNFNSSAKADALCDELRVKSISCIIIKD